MYLDCCPMAFSLIGLVGCLPPCSFRVFRGSHFRRKPEPHHGITEATEAARNQRSYRAAIIGDSVGPDCRPDDEPRSHGVGRCRIDFGRDAESFRQLQGPPRRTRRRGSGSARSACYLPCRTG